MVGVELLKMTEKKYRTIELIIYAFFIIGILFFLFYEFDGYLEDKANEKKCELIGFERFSGCDGKSFCGYGWGEGSQEYIFCSNGTRDYVIYDDVIEEIDFFRQ